MLDRASYIEAIRESVPLFVSAAQSDLAAHIPSCPAWNMTALVAHLGLVERFWTYIVEQRAPEYVDMPPSALGVPEDEAPWYLASDEGHADMSAVPPGLLDWYQDSAARLIAAFEATSDDEPIWHWSGDNRGITHMRNQAMEHTFHRWDAENAVGPTTPIDPRIAVDAIDQHFDVQIAASRGYAEWSQGSGESYHLHRTDGAGEWTVRFDGPEFTITRGHVKGDVAVRGSAEALALWLWGRGDLDSLEILGDRAVFERYHEFVPAG
jgi:uncharacterized protein (TIGR03083 family)